MEQSPDSAPPSNIPWLRSWIVLGISLTVPWLLMGAPSGALRNGNLINAVIPPVWQITHAVWFACALGLAVHRAELCPAVIAALGTVIINLLLTSLASNINAKIPALLFVVLIAQVLGFVIALALRNAYTIAHRSEYQYPLRNEDAQYSLRSLFLATLVFAVIAALLSAAVHARRIRQAEDVIPWLFLLNMALLWNELMQARLCFSHVIVCSLVVGGLWAWSNSVRIPDWLGTALIIAVVYIFPLAYRWAGWRIVRRDRMPSSGGTTSKISS